MGKQTVPAAWGSMLVRLDCMVVGYINVTGYEEIRDDFLSSNEDPGYTGCDDTQMEIPVNRSNLTAVVPSPEWQNLVFESGIVDSEPRRLLRG